MSFTTMQIIVGAECALRMRLLEVKRRAIEQAIAVPTALPETRKCDCCGSREFRQHRERRICAYCRSGA